MIKIELCVFVCVAELEILSDIVTISDIHLNLIRQCV